MNAWQFYPSWVARRFLREEPTGYVEFCHLHDLDPDTGDYREEYEAWLTESSDL